MKRLALSSLAIVLSSLAISSPAIAKPVNFNSPEADLNGDNVVTMVELSQYHLERSTHK
ncbi:MAG: hypothetical protein AAF810_09170 [Cyanobacteria bacterium P01_D01_bin.36]